MASTQYLMDYDFGIAYGPLDDRMNGLYIPALLRSVRYDRTLRIFSPDALAYAARGVEGLIRNRGGMRLLINADFKDEDRKHLRDENALMKMLRDKYLARLETATARTSQKLEVLGRLAVERTLEIRIMMPKQENRLFGLMQPTMGIFTDTEGNQLCYYGYVDDAVYEGDQNEEQLMVYKSWETGAQYLQVIQPYFDRLWEGKEPGWRSLALPEGVMKRLMQFRQRVSTFSTRDEDAFSEKPALKAELRESIVSQYLSDIKYFPWTKAEMSHKMESDDAGKSTAAASVLQNPEACGLPLLRWEAGPHDPVVVYYHLKGDQMSPVETLAELESVLSGRLLDDGPSILSEIKAREHFHALLKSRENIRGKSIHTAFQEELKGVSHDAARVLVKAALCDIARSRHATLFDEDLQNADFNAATIQRQKKKGPPFSELMSLLNPSEPLILSQKDPFLKEVEGRTTGKIQAAEVKLVAEGRELIRKWAELKSRRPIEQTQPQLTVRKYFATVRKERPRLILLIAPPRGDRFTRYLPFYTPETLMDKFVRGGNAREEGWMEIGLGKKLNKSMFVVRTEGRAMEPLISEGHFSVFESDIRGSLDGAILMIYGKDIDDPDTNSHLTVRKLTAVDKSLETGQYREIVLDALHPDYQRLQLRDVDNQDFRIIGRYVGGV